MQINKFKKTNRKFVENSNSMKTTKGEQSKREKVK